jgi:CheY-like chemotaxis protein
MFNNPLEHAYFIRRRVENQKAEREGLMTQAQVSPAEAAGEEFPPDLAGKLSILVVDDDPIQREFSRVYLSTPTAEVHLASCAAEGLALLEARRIDLALIDVEMPGMDGVELVRLLRANPRFADLPIMVVTGHEDVESIDRAYDAGATAFMAKPVNWRILAYHLRFLARAAEAMREAR